jgi:ABC-type lipoprotein release transport system permease subunit
MGIARGLADQAADSVAAGADLYVTAERLGRTVPVPLSAAEALRAMPGVTGVAPRIVSPLRMGAQRVPAVLVGMPAETFPTASGALEGRLPAAPGRNELVVGAQLARRLALTVGGVIPPFYRNEDGERVSTIVGVFRADVPIWGANVLLTDFETASRIGGLKGMASGLLVSCRPEYRDAVRNAIVTLPSLGPADAAGPLRPRVMARDEVAAVLPEGLLRREGVMSLHFVVAFAVAILSVLVTSGVGLAERRRETGLLKALGWQTDEVLLRGAAESLVLAALGASISVLIAWTWLAVFNGWAIAGVFLSGGDVSPGFAVPFRLTPEPVLVGTAVAFAVTMVGTLISTWRAATAEPVEAMR